MKRPPAPRGFTLIEMIVVIAVILVLAALTIGIAAYAIRKGNDTRASNEILAMKTSCEAYKLDNGIYPQNADTDALDPRVDADPGAPKYQKASLYLYSCLTGDFLPAGAPDGKPESANRSYGSFLPKQLRFTGTSGSNSGSVLFIQDPFGFPYGYSTAGNQVEAAYRAAVRANPNASRPTELKGFDPTFDLWSTGGGTTISQQGKWLKSWSSK